MPRKSNPASAIPGDEPKSATTKTSRDSVGVEDLGLPRTLVQRIAKGCLQPGAQVSKDTLLALSKSVTVFVNYVAATASEHATAAGKRTITTAHVVAALKDHEFEAFLPRVEAEAQRYTDLAANKRNEYKLKAAKKPDDESMDVDGPTAADEAEEIEVDEDGRPMKKARRDGHEATNGHAVDEDDVEADEEGEGDVDVDVDVDDGDEQAADDAQSESGSASGSSDASQDEDQEESDRVQLGGPIPDEALDDGDDSD